MNPATTTTTTTTTASTVSTRATTFTDNNLETFSLVWLDNAINESPENLNTQQKLRKIINHLRIFDNNNDCETYIQSVSSYDRIIIIVSGILGRRLVPRIHSLRQIEGVIVKSNDLINQIQKDQAKRIKIKVNEALSINIFNTDQGKSTTGLNGQFVHSQLLIDCLLRMKSCEHEKNDLISLCKEQYEGNPHELSIIDDFEKSYASCRALWWYTRQTFLYRLLNKALRVLNVDLIYLFRFFIRDLHRQLLECRSSSLMRVYRGQLIFHEELEILKNSVGQFISINSFLSTSQNRDLALCFSRDSNQCEKVLFEIDVNSQNDDEKPFADISSFSYYPDESEVLFMLGSIFRIVSVSNNNDGLWIINMTLSSENDHALKPILEHMKNQHNHDQTDLISFGHVLRNMGKFCEAENYYRRLLDSAPTDSQELGRCYHALGIIAYEKGDYNASLNLHEKSLDIKLNSLKSDDPHLASSYNSIGTIYEKKNDYARALQSFHKSLAILKEAYGDDHPRLAVCLNNIAGIYQTEKKYDEALEYNKKALCIREKHLPADHPDLGASHSNIGIIYRCLGKYDLALKHHNRSLDIHQKTLPPQHPQIASTLTNVGLVYEDKGEFTSALDHYERALSIYHCALPPTHPNIIKTEQFIQRVSLKIK